MSPRPDSSPSLKENLATIWSSETRNVPFEKTCPECNTDDIPQSKVLCAKLLGDRMRVLKTANPDDVTVVVNGYGPNLIEVWLWLQLGVRVVAVEKEPHMVANLRRVAATDPAHFGNLTVYLSTDADIPPGDIVMWNHPSNVTTADITQHMKPDSLLVVQNDKQPNAYQTPSYKDLLRLFDVLLDEPVDSRHYFFPSLYLGNGDRVVVLQTRGP